MTARAGRLTVAICTWRRPGSLRATLAALARVREPPAWEWELVVVDNGGDAATRRVIAEAPDRLPVRRVHEPTLGLSHARNRAVSEASGDWLLWTDDDVLVPEGWLEAYADAIDRFPDAAFLGGGIEPRFSRPPPGWVEAAWPDVAPLLALRTPPGDGAPVRSRYPPYGANLAIRADAQRRHRYDPRLGRRGSELRSGEEWEVLSALLAEGCEGRWVGGATVHHVLPPDRLTLEHLGGIVRAEGRVDAERPADGTPRLGRSAALWRDWLLAEARARLARRLAGPATWVPAYLRAQRTRGALDGLGP